MPEEKPQNNEYISLWENIEKELAKEDKSASKIAVLEAEKIFQKILRDKNLPGKDTQDKIKNYSHLFSNPDKLKYSRAMHDKIISQIGFDISNKDTQEIIAGYREAIDDLEKINFKTLALKEQIDLFLKRNFYDFPRIGKELVAGIAILSLATFIITETESGETVALYWINANNFLFYKIIPAILALIALGILTLILFSYYQKKK